jgi:predicted dinucleotide-binding enzyme
MVLCRNNMEAKAQVTSVLRQFGCDPFDYGSSVAARAIEHALVYSRLPQ